MLRVHALAVGCLLFLLPVLLFSQPHPAYFIKGEVIGDSIKATKVYLQRQENGSFINIDSAALTEGRFQMRGTVMKPEITYLSLPPHQHTAGFYLENSPISIYLHIDSLDRPHVSGSREEDAYQSFLKMKETTASALSDILARYDAQPDSDSVSIWINQFDSIVWTMLPNIARYVETHGNYACAARMLYNALSDFRFSPEQTERMFTALGVLPKMTPAFQHIDDEYKKQYGRLAMGRTAPDFSLLDSVGGRVVLSALRMKNLIVNFWSSSCDDCSKQNNALKQLLKRHPLWHNKLTVVNIATDEDKDQWKKAIREAGIPGYHLSAQQGLNSPVFSKYNISSIPTMFLLDEKGKIITWQPAPYLSYVLMRLDIMLK